MHGRKCFVLAALLFASCSSSSIMKPDCHSCTVEDQAWNEFAWGALPGRWQGSVETFRNEKSAAKKVKTETRADLRFLSGADFLTAQKSPSCTSLPANAVVLNGRLWSASMVAGSAAAVNEYEAFIPVEGDKVAYGRLSFSNLNGQRICHFRRFGAVMGQNRLALPTVQFSEASRGTVGSGASVGRDVASLVNMDNEMSVEFLRFAPTEAKATAFKADGRSPAAIAVKEKPALMIRVYRVSSRAAGERGEWNGSEEQLYRLWKAE